MIWQREARLSGLVFLNSDGNEIGFQNPHWVEKEQEWPSLLNDRKHGHSSVVVHHPEKPQEETIVVLGGREKRSIAYETVPSVYLWNAENTSWREGPSMLKARAHLTAVVAGEHVYVIGGYNSDFKPLKTIDRIAIQDLLHSGTSTDNKKWKAFPCCLATPRVHANAVSVHDRYIVVAGGTIHSAPIGSVEIIDTHSPSSSVAFAGPNLNHPRHSFEMEVVQNRVYVVAGKHGHRSVQGSSVEYLDFDPHYVDAASHGVKSRAVLSTWMSWTVHGDRNLQDLKSSEGVVRVGSCLLFVDTHLVLDMKRNKSWKFGSTPTFRWDRCYSSHSGIVRMVALSKGVTGFESYIDTRTLGKRLVFKQLELADKESLLFKRLLDCSGRQIQSLKHQALFMYTKD